jgi:LysR family cyn operon transcriptional activator
MLLRPIHYLKAVADHGSFTRAAATLRVSQPALSQQIREFEERMGVQLLDRTGRTVRPTDAGEAYLRHVRRALDELEVGGRSMSSRLAAARSAMFRTCRAARCVSGVA